MKLTRCLFYVMITVALAVPAAFSQLGTTTTTVTIPFAFTVQDQVLPSGTYTLEWINTRIYIRSSNLKQGTFISTNSVEGKENRERDVLEFTRYGHTYFLSRIWYAGRRDGRELPVSKLQAEMANKHDGKKVELGP